jgi:hypothetical protein
MACGLIVPARGGLVWRLVLAVALALALLGGVAPAPAAAAMIEVRSGADGGGSCPGADCTLRQALAVANDGDTITFAPAVTEVTLTTAELVVDASVTIQGSGTGGVRVARSAVGGTPRFRVFHISGGAVVTLRGLTVANGDVDGDGGGILVEGGGLTVEAGVVADNTARAAPNSSTVRGGGIAALNAPVTLTNSTVSGNKASVTSSGEGTYFSGSAYGGGVYTSASGDNTTVDASVTLTDSTVSGNEARVVGPADSFYGNAYGGGVYTAANGTDGVYNGGVTLARTTVSGNIARAEGAATQSFGGSAYGGGVYAYGGGIGVQASAPVALTDSVVEGNEARVASTGASSYFSGYAYGGGVYAVVNGIDAVLNGGVTLARTTVSGNAARAEGAATESFSGSAYGGGVYAAGGGIGGQASAPVALTGSAVEGNEARVASTGAGSYFNGYAYGGGLYAVVIGIDMVLNGGVTLARTTVSGNAARAEGAASQSFNGSAYGGGVHAHGGVELTDSAVDSNEASLASTGAGSYFSGSAYGGGVYASSAALLRSTVSGNAARAEGAATQSFSGYAYGGGVNAHGGVTLDHATLADNTASHPTSAAGQQLYLNGSGSAARSVFAHSNPALAGGYIAGGTFTSQGHNVSQHPLPGAVGSDLTGTDPRIAPLGDYGGPTRTRALLVGSPAIGHVPASGAGCAAADQRGVARPQPGDGACDAGAFESRGFTLAVAGGDGQSAAINTAFAAPLQARVVPGDQGVPVQGIAVSFAGPASGAGIQGAPLSATTDATGLASVTPTANGTVGGPYTVTATAAGVGGSAAFSLTNTAIPTTLVADAATGVYSGTTTLRAALTATSGGTGIAGKTIVFTVNGAAVCGGGGQPACPTTDSGGVATLATVSLAGVGAGSYPAGVGASFAGDATHATASDTAALTVNKAAAALTQVQGVTTYGDATGSLTATLRRTNGDGGPVVGATVVFAVNGVPVGGATTNAQGVATLPAAALPAGLNAGSYGTALGASFAGDANHLAASASGPLRVARKVLWVKAQDRTVGLRQPNPPTAPPVGCVAQQTATRACWLELANGSTFVNGDDWGDLSLAQLRFTYNRNPPATNASERVGTTYRITAFGVTSQNYDIRYQPGTLTVVAAP